jgi:hypothetical protein
MRKYPNSHREAKATAPVLDSTLESLGVIRIFLESVEVKIPTLSPKRREGWGTPRVFTADDCWLIGGVFANWNFQ